MTSPRTALGVRRAFPGALFGSKIVSPVQAKRPQPQRIRPVTDFCPELVGLVSEGDLNVLLGVFDGSLYGLSEATGGYRVLRYSLPDLTLAETIPFDVDPIDLLSLGSFDYESQGVLLPDGSYYQWKYIDASTEVRLERWIVSAGEYVLDDDNVSTIDGEHWIGQTYNPCDGLLYVFSMDFRGGGDTALPVRQVDPATGSQTDYSPDTVEPAPYLDLFFHHPLLANDGAVWVNWTDGSSSGGFYRVAPGGVSQDQITFNDPPFEFMPVVMPYGPSSVLATDVDSGDAWIVTSDGTLSPSSGANCVAFAASVYGSRFFFAHRVVYGDGFAYYFAQGGTSGLEVWRTPLSCP